MSEWKISDEQIYVQMVSKLYLSELDCQAVRDLISNSISLIVSFSCILPFLGLLPIDGLILGKYPLGSVPDLKWVRDDFYFLSYDCQFDVICCKSYGCGK